MLWAEAEIPWKIKQLVSNYTRWKLKVRQLRSECGCFWQITKTICSDRIVITRPFLQRVEKQRIEFYVIKALKQVKFICDLITSITNKKVTISNLLATSCLKLVESKSELLVNNKKLLIKKITKNINQHSKWLYQWNFGTYKFCQ